MSATYTKLKDGSWGVHVTGDKPQTGRPLTVQKKDGSMKTETIARVIWSGDDKWRGGKVHLCSLEKVSTPRSQNYAYSSGPTWRGNGCSACRSLGNWCPQCAFDEFDN